MSRSSLSVVFAGSGGSGAMTAGTLFLRSAALAGYCGLMTQLFGAQVRGGEAAALVQVSTDPIDCQPDLFDIFVALDWEKLEQFAPEIPLDDRSIIMVDPASGSIPTAIAKSTFVFLSNCSGRNVMHGLRTSSKAKPGQRMASTKRRTRGDLAGRRSDHDHGRA